MKLSVYYALIHSQSRNGNFRTMLQPKRSGSLIMDVNIRIWLVLSLLIASATITSPASRAIQGGESAKGTGFVVALVIQINDTSGTLCSGGLVAPRVVATAAHCVVKRGVLAKSDSILVFTPGSELSSPTAAKVQNIFVPEGYENSSDAGEPNDIAFLVFDRPLGQVTIDTVADQLVSLLSFFGILCHIPGEVMGLTVLAIGNSIGDLTANATMARKGLVNMAITACFAGPMFSVLIGVGLAMYIWGAELSDLHLTQPLQCAILFSILNCALLLICGFHRGHLYKSYSYGALILYAVYGCFSLYIIS